MGTTLDWVFAALIAASSVACQSKNSAQPTDGGDLRIIYDAGASSAIPPDGPSLCTDGSCNYQTQLGCDAGYMCHPQLGTDQNVTPTCQPAGSKGAGESCVWLGCQPGYLCAADARCHRMCCGGDWSACEADESCTGAIELLASGSSTPVPAGVGVCEPTDDCDVFDPSSCPVGQSCYIIDSRGGVGCRVSGSAEAYESCSSTQLCKGGLTCVSAGKATGQCRRLCRAVPGGGAPSCPAAEGMTCAHYVNDPPGVGECIASVDGR
jgi:hypothetical protein